MSKESTTPDLEEKVRRAIEADRRDLEASTGFVELRAAMVATWADGLIERLTVYANPDEARAAAERLAEERG